MIRVLRDRTTTPKGFVARRRQRVSMLKRARARKDFSAHEFWQRLRPGLADDIEALHRVFTFKCAYCESAVLHGANLEVDHFRPKGDPRFTPRMFDWDNWLTACKRCNQSKGTQFPESGGKPNLLDPTSDDPSEHLEFVEHRAVAVSRRGQETLSLLRLQRSHLLEQRQQWLLQLDMLLLLCTLPRARKEARRLLLWCMQPQAPYCAMARMYLREKVPKLAGQTLQAAPIEIQDPMASIHALVDKYTDQLARLE